MNPQQLIDAVAKAERDERARRGLPEHHLLSFDEFPFKFAGPALETFTRMVDDLHRQQPNAAAAVMLKAIAALAHKDYAAANRLLKQYQTLAPQHAVGRMRFGEVPGPPAELPEVEGPYPTRPGFFLACSGSYFEPFAAPLLRSIASFGTSLSVHVHLMDGARDAVERTAADLSLNVTLSAEDSSGFIARHKIQAKDYYGAARLVRFSDALRGVDGPLWMADVDALVTSDPSPLLLRTESAALRVRPGRLEPWHQFSACLIMGSPASRSYFDRVAAIVRADLPYAWWGLDQYSLFSAWVGLRPDIALLGPDIAAVDDTPGLFWFTAGAKKDALGADGSAYARLYRRFTS